MNESLDGATYEAYRRLEIAKNFAEHLPIGSNLIVFGSTTREVARPDSDLDMMGTVDSFKNALLAGSLKGLPKIAPEELEKIPADVTNISFDTKIDGVDTHIEVYDSKWLLGLLSDVPLGTHRSAIYDPEGNFHKKEFGSQPTMQGTIKRFPRNMYREGAFVIFEDFEPDDPSAVRIEQRKLVVCDPIISDEPLAKALEENRTRLMAAARTVLGKDIVLEDLVHVFGRVEGSEIRQMQFSAAKRRETIDSLGLVAEASQSYELLRPLPNSLRVSITERCNLQCVYCMGEGTPPAHVSRGEDMAPAKFLEMANIWKEMGGKKIKFTGGEPFLNRDLPAYLAYCAELGMETSITTNGYFLTPEKFDLLAKHNVSLIVSLDTLAEGQKSKMSPVGKAARAISDRVVAGREYGLDISVNTVLTAYSRESVLSQMIPWALEHDIKLRVLEEGTVLADRTTENHEPLEKFIEEVSEQYGLTIVPKGEFGDSLALKDGKPVIHFLTSFCGRQDADSCGENSIRIDYSGRGVPCMMGGDRIPVSSAKDLATAINSQGTCRHGSSH